MALKDRNLLKSLFKNGRKPTEGNFEDLIDSMVNKTDDKWDLVSGRSAIPVSSENETTTIINKQYVNVTNPVVNPDTFLVPADGNWHSVISTSTGLISCEILAATTEPSGFSGMIYAIVLSGLEILVIKQTLISEPVIEGSTSWWQRFIPSPSTPSPPPPQPNLMVQLVGGILEIKSTKDISQEGGSINVMIRRLWG